MFRAVIGNGNACRVGLLMYYPAVHRRRCTLARKTKLMLRVEKEFDRPLERLLPELVNDQGMTATADTLGVSKATLGYWMLKMGINVRRVALAPGEVLEVKRTDYSN